jgi:hypothetical protein
MQTTKIKESRSSSLKSSTKKEQVRKNIQKEEKIVASKLQATKAADMPQGLPGRISINLNMHSCCHSDKPLIVHSMKSSISNSQHMVACSFLYFKESISQCWCNVHNPRTGIASLGIAAWKEGEKGNKKWRNQHSNLLAFVIHSATKSKEEVLQAYSIVKDSANSFTKTI